MAPPNNFNLEMNNNSLQQTAAGNPSTDPVFLRLPTGSKRDVWRWSPLTYWELRTLISPGPWNNHNPVIRAYSLCKPGAQRGTVLIEHLDLAKWWNTQFEKRYPSLAPVPLPQIQPPPVLRIPPSGGVCPFTQLKHTTLYELSLPQSPYGQTKIYMTRYAVPGRGINPIVMETQSLLQYIRSCPPPRYKITPRIFPLPQKTPPGQPVRIQA